MTVRKNIFQKGFTLVELLVVIAILGILSVGLIAAIDPADKINATSDSRAINDLGVLARASESYATANNGSYPVGTDYATVAAVLVASNDLRVAPSAPTGYTYTAVGTASGVYFKTTLKASANKSGTNATAVVSSTNGKQCTKQVSTATACP